MKNNFYALSNWGWITSFNLSSIDDYDKPVQVNTLTEWASESFRRVYRVESSKGDQESEVRITNSTNVYKLVLDATNEAIRECIEMTSLDGDALFVGFSYSWCVCATEDIKEVSSKISSK